jgi:uncharacterized protein YraI
MSSRRLRRLTLAAMCLFLLLVNGCGGPGAATATALPPDVARPSQPTPDFDNPAADFRLTPVAMPTWAAPAVAATPVPLPARPTVVAPLEQTPTALGIAIVPLVLAASPNGPSITELPVGTTLTITGRSADGAWLAGYTSAGVAGWVPTSAVTLFGGADLTIVERAVPPAAVATLIATAMLPVTLPEGVAAADAPADRPTGTVLPAEGVALLQSPQPAATEVGRIAAGQRVQIIGRSADGSWLVVMAGSALGWTPLDAIGLDNSTTALPVIQP